MIRESDLRRDAAGKISRNEAGLRAIDFLHDRRVPVEVTCMFYGDVLEALIDALHAIANDLPPAPRDDDADFLNDGPEVDDEDYSVEPEILGVQ